MMLGLGLLMVAASCAPNGSSKPDSGASSSRDDAKSARSNTPQPSPAADQKPAPEAAATEVVDPAPATTPAPTMAPDAMIDSGIVRGEPMIDGGISRDIIRRKAQDHAADLRACGDAAALAIEFEIDSRGIVTDVELGEGTKLDDKAVVDCILEQIATWTFAAEVTAAAKVELNLDLSEPDPH
jgi:hypothetical protein